jgi:molybdenum cofactor biosynthesis enzyme MoaA
VRDARVVTNETCNQNCGFCNARRAVERHAITSATAIRARVRTAAARGAEEIVFTGGEPSLRRDLEGIVAFARAEGLSVALETNATLINPVRAFRLAAAGLGTVRVHIPAWGDPADAITRDRGGFVSARRGIDACLAAEIPVELSVPVVRANRELIEGIPIALAREHVAVRGIVVVIPTLSHNPESLLPVREATTACTALVACARDAGIPVRIDSNAFVPPCAFPNPDLVAEIYSMTRGGEHRPGYQRAERCAECVAFDRCPGAPSAIPGFNVVPLRQTRLLRRLSTISTIAEQIERELVTHELYRGTGDSSRGVTIRVNFHCNQACEFCFVSTHLPAPADERVREAIISAAQSGATVVLSGGEPTLNSQLLSYVRLARESGAKRMELQTNAVRLAEGALARTLFAAGLTDALVSLHGATAEVSEAITGAPGTYEATLRGITALVEAGTQVRLNFVFCNENAAQFPEYVDLLTQRWPSVSLSISFVALSTDLVPRTERLVPRYTDVLPHLSEGLRRAHTRGLHVTGFDSMCGIPLCLVPADLSGYLSLDPIPEGFDRGEFVHSDACRECALLDRCFGIRRGYVELHGADELRTVPDASLCHGRDCDRMPVEVSTQDGDAQSVAADRRDRSQPG